MLIAGSRAIVLCESCQVRNEAALSKRNMCLGLAWREFGFCFRPGKRFDFRVHGFIIFLSILAITPTLFSYFLKYRFIVCKTRAYNVKYSLIYDIIN